MDHPFNSETFFLFEDARPGGSGGRLYRQPRSLIVAQTLEEVASALDEIRAAVRNGAHAAGWLSYEAGFAFEPRLGKAPERHHPPLVCFGIFDDFLSMSRAQIEGALPDPNGAWLSMPRPRITKADYDQAFDRAKQYIVAGDIYQVNLSYRADLNIEGSPLAAYARLRDAGQGGWSVLAHALEHWQLSTSPELFFRLRGRTIEAKPMKGTARRSSDPVEDRELAEALRRDPKELAENVMIVDLMRNDISRLATRGSVKTPELFAVETYPTLHTLTSTVRAEIQDEYDAIDILAALFPCGSVTGAPKIRAMEIIRELELDGRGAYTGSFGWIEPSGDAEFNVAIRTLTVRGNEAELGVGSAVVYDSTSEGEWAECAVKAAFVTKGNRPFDLIETMRVETDSSIQLLDFHLARLTHSARTFGFRFEETDIIAAVERTIQEGSEGGVSRLRLTLDKGGGVSLAMTSAPKAFDGLARVRIAPLPVDATDFRLAHKTTLRDFYDSAREQSGADEVVFVDTEGRLTEGSFTNVFVERGGVLVTPPLTRGLLPGVLRASLIASGRAHEGDLRPGDLGAGFYLGNALRGLVPAKVLED